MEDVSEKSFGPFSYNRYSDERTFGIRIPNIINLRVAFYTPSFNFGMTFSGDVAKVNIPVTVDYRFGLPWPYLHLSIDLFFADIVVILGKC